MIVCLLVALAVAAEPAPLDLLDAIDIGATRGPAAQLVNPRRGVAIAEARAKGAFASDPSLAWERDDHGDLVSLSVPVELDALLRRDVNQRWRAVSGQDARMERVAAGIAAGAAWLDARRAQEIARLAAADQALAAELQRAAKARVAAGEWPPADGALLQAEAARALGRSLDAQQQAHLATLHLQALLGQDLDGKLVLGDWPSLPPAPPIPPNGSPAVARAELARRAAHKEAQAAPWVRVPDLSLQTGATLGDAPAPLYGLELSLPMGRSPQRAQAAAQVADVELIQARAAEAEARAAVGAELQVTALLVEAWQIDGLDQIDRAEGQRLLAGELSIPDYVGRHQLALDARLGAVDARWRRCAAELALWSLAGELPGIDE